MVRVNGDREHRPGLPLKHAFFPAFFLPDLSRPSPFYAEELLFIYVLLHVQRTTAGDLNNVATPQSLGPVELNKGALAPHARPRLAGQILHLAYSKVANDRDLLLIHELVVWQRGPRKSTCACLLRPILRFMPMIWCLVHIRSPIFSAVDIVSLRRQGPHLISACILSTMCLGVAFRWRAISCSSSPLRNVSTMFIFSAS